MSGLPITAGRLPQMAADVDLMEKVVAVFPQRIGAGGDLMDSYQKASNFAYSETRSLANLMRRIDSSEHWGGLRRLFTPEGDSYWLCASHFSRLT